MRKRQAMGTTSYFLGLLALGLAVTLGVKTAAQSPPEVPATGPRLIVLEDSYLRWPLPASAQQYGAIDGRRLKPYVEEIVAISRKSRDDGNQFWGRITGTSYEAQTQQWQKNRFQRAGLQDVRVQPLDVPSLWFPTAWQVSVASTTKTIPLATAHPALETPSTPPGGLELKAAWVGLGTAADFAGRAVRGKAVFI